MHMRFTGRVFETISLSLLQSRGGNDVWTDESGLYVFPGSGFRPDAYDEPFFERCVLWIL